LIPAASDEETDYKRMCVSALRRRLDEKSLELDGSRDTLISRLEEEEKLRKMMRMMTVPIILVVHPMSKIKVYNYSKTPKQFSIPSDRLWPSLGRLSLGCFGDIVRILGP
jgi:hypothetical protein